MTEQTARPTPGPWEACGLWVCEENDPGHDVGICGCEPRPEAEANARLIAEAGTVLHETGLSPRQLADQRALLLMTLREALEFIEGKFDVSPYQAPALALAINAIIARAEARS